MIKVKLPDGTDIECETVTEYKAILEIKTQLSTSNSSINIEKNSNRKKETVHENKHKRYNRQSANFWHEIIEQATKIIKNSDKPMSMKKLILTLGLSVGGPNYNKLKEGLKRKHRIRIQYNKLYYEKPVDKTTYNIQEQTPKKEDMRQKRSKFIASRANVLQKNYNWSREKAWTFASDEWNKYNINKNIDEDARKFPRFDMLTCDATRLLRIDVVNMINRSTHLDFSNIAHLKLKNSSYWTETDYDEFKQKFLENSTKMAKFYNVKDRFRIVNNQIMYG